MSYLRGCTKEERKVAYNIRIDDADIYPGGYRKFSGGRYGRSFAVGLPNDIVQVYKDRDDTPTGKILTPLDLMEDGWPVNKRENSQTQEVEYFLNVKLKYDRNRPELDPQVWMGNEGQLDEDGRYIVSRISEDNVGELDQARIAHADVVINAFNYLDDEEEVHISVFLKKLWAITKRRPDERLYAMQEYPRE